MTRKTPLIRQRARALRRDMTPHERRLWHELRRLNRDLGTNFRRRAPIGTFIADFADLGRRLVIELDGGQHADAGGASHDLRLDAWLEGQGFRVLRFWNSDPIPAVMAAVLDHVAAPHPHPLPTRGRGAALQQGNA